MSKEKRKKDTTMSEQSTSKKNKEAVEIQVEEKEAENEEGTGTDESLEEKETTPEDKIVELEKELSELKDQYLRKQADFENFRKRMIREKEESIKFSNSTLILDLIPIIDDFERAIKSAEDSKDFASFHQGIELIEKQFLGMLERKWGLKRFEAGGEVFDPEKHEALLMEESEDVDVPKVVEDYQKGYVLHDRVLRHAKVKVHMPVGGSTEQEEDETE